MRMRTLAAASLLASLALSACKTSEALDPAAIQAKNESAVQEDVPGTTADALLPTPAALPPAGPVREGVRLQFAPVVGATVDTATPLARRLSARAAERGLVIVGKEAVPASHLLKGYFSAIAEDKETIVIFVWDVIGPDGNRLHRIQGQERVAASAENAWTIVPPQTMETIADRTIDELSRWLETHPG